MPDSRIAPDAVLSWKELKPIMGATISELRRAWRAEQATAAAKLASQIDRIETRLIQLEQRLGWPDEDNNAAA
jgi:hypothetical protein